MDAGRDLRLLLPAPVRNLPADLAAVVGLTLVTLVVVFVPVINGTPLRVAFGLGFVLFLPGYVFIAALFPEAGESPVEDEPDATGAPTPDDGPAVQPGTTAAEAASGDEEDEQFLGGAERSGIDGIERVALSFGLSIAIVPLIGLVLNFTPWGIRLVPIVVSLTGFTLVCTAVAARRRWDLPPDERFSVPYREWLAAGRAELLEPEDRTDAALNVLLAVSVLLAVGSVGYAVAVPKQGESFTQFYILTENEDGELVADNYPQEFVIGESADLVVGIGNDEHTTESYTVVTQLQAVDTVDNETVVREREELDRYSATLEHNETRHTDVTLTPRTTGDDLRIKFLLYRGEAPAEPRTETAYRDLHLWIEVRESES